MHRDFRDGLLCLLGLPGLPHIANIKNKLDLVEDKVSHPSPSPQRGQNQKHTRPGHVGHTIPLEQSSLGGPKWWLAQNGPKRT